MENKIPLLDHGFIRLVDSMGNDLSVVRAARVSFNAEWRAGSDVSSDSRLIEYLWRNAHSTPFEAVEFQFEVKAPIFVLRQWHRHRTWTYNELSARYKELSEEFYTPTPENIGTQSKDNKQARDFLLQSEVELDKRRQEINAYTAQCTAAFALYHCLLADGWPRELARTALPVSTYSHMFAKTDLKNLLHFLSLRLHPHAQHEIRVYAEAILGLIEPIVPNCISAWKKSK